MYRLAICKRHKELSAHEITFDTFEIFIRSESPLPQFIFAGDNDYLDCPDKEQAWDRYLDTFKDFDKEWKDDLPSGARKLDVDRWDERRDVDGADDAKRREMFALKKMEFYLNP